MEFSGLNKDIAKDVITILKTEYHNEVLGFTKGPSLDDGETWRVKRIDANGDQRDTSLALMVWNNGQWGLKWWDGSEETSSKLYLSLIHI